MIFDEYFGCYGGDNCIYLQGFDDGYGYDYHCKLLDDWIIDWTDDLVHENCPMLYGFIQNEDYMQKFGYYQ